MRTIGTIVSATSRHWHNNNARAVVVPHRVLLSGVPWHTRSDRYYYYYYSVAGSWASSQLVTGSASLVGNPCCSPNCIVVVCGVRSLTTTTTTSTTCTTNTITPSPRPPSQHDGDTTNAPQQQQQQQRQLLLHDEYWVNRVETGELCYNVDQKRAAKRLQRLQITLQNYSNEPALQAYNQQQEQLQQQQPEVVVGASTNKHHHTTPSSDQQQQLSAVGAATAAETSHHPQQQQQPIPKVVVLVPRGLYLYGSVGTGKSMLMDAFFVHTECLRKRRFHFHEFVADIHRRLHAQKLKYDTEKKERTRNVEDKEAARHLMEGGGGGGDKNADQSSTTGGKTNRSPPRQDYVNPVTAVALEMAAEMSLLCLDEFQVLDVADAVILSQLFTILFRVGTVLVTTSNRPVTEIYSDGLQHRHNNHHLTPLIHSLQRYCILHPIQSDIDYRLLMQSDTMTTTSSTTTAVTSNGSRGIDDVATGGVKSMFFVNNTNGEELAQKPRFTNGEELAQKPPFFEEYALRAFLTKQVHDDGPAMVVTDLPDVILDTGFQRSLRIRTRSVQQAGSSDISDITLACCNFDELCGGQLVSLCASDYRAIARARQVWDAIVVENIPVVSDSSAERGTGHNQARRFITLIDELYEAKVPLLCSAMAPPSQLFLCNTVNESTTTLVHVKNENDLEEDDNEILGMDQAVDSHGHAVGALASVKELPFAFRRASSRLVEMTSLKWWKPVLDKIRGNLSGP